MNECIFCRIANGELESARLCENPLVLAFLDIRPINAGHTLVIPRRHVESFTKLTTVELSALMHMAQNVARALKTNGCESVTLSMADGTAAGQEVPHAHLHIIPRHAQDQFGWKRFGTAVHSDELATTAAQIQGILAD